MVPLWADQLLPQLLIERFDTLSSPGFPQTLEIMENLENHQKKFNALKNQGI